MQILIGCVATVIVVLLGIILPNLIKGKTVINKIEKSMSQMLYLWNMAGPLVIFAIVNGYIEMNPLICSLVWIGIIGVMDKLSTRKNCIDIAKKPVLIFLAMLLGVIFPIIQWVVVEHSSKYTEIAYTMGALIVGFFVPLDIILSDTYPKKKCVEIVKGIGFNNLECTTVAMYIVCIGLLVIVGVIEKMGIKNQVDMGIVVGIIILLVVFAKIPKKFNNSIEDCIDYRENLFDSQLFKEYRFDIENKLGLSHEEWYDHVEVFLFYEAFLSKDKNKCFVAKTVEPQIYEVLQNSFSTYKKYKVSVKNKTQKYILKNGQKEYVYEYLVNAWEIFSTFIHKFSNIQFEDGDIPQVYKVKYEAWGFVTEKERWLLFFLEQYHCLSRKEREQIVPAVLRDFAYSIYKDQALWAVPKKCISYCQNDKNLYEFGKYSSCNVLLSIAYEWFKRKRDGGSTREYLEKVVKRKTYINAFESWFCEYENWESFVLSNKLNKFVNKKISWASYGFCKPRKIFDLKLSNKDNIEKEKKKWIKALKKTEDMIYYRF